MEKVTLYVKRILVLGLSFLVFVLASLLINNNNPDAISFVNGNSGFTFVDFVVLFFSFLLFSYLSFRITGEKPRFLFGMNQSDSFLNEKGGFWNLFKWIVSLFGFMYDLLVWALWGVFQLFVVFAEVLLLIKEVLYWIIHALIWFIRQLFPPFIFMFKMFMHYVVNWIWWLYQVSVNNVKTSINSNFYFIALWGAVPALFIVFLFYAISQVVGIPGLTAISIVFALVPIVWSYGEIAALRYEQREGEEYPVVQSKFSNGFMAVRSVLFYLILIVIFLVAEIVLNLLGWIPNLSMSFLGITLNINMALSFLLVFLAVIISFAGGILPTYILHHPEHDNDLQSTLAFLKTLGNKFLRYIFIEPFNFLFGSILLIIPVLVMFAAFSLTEGIKDSVLEKRVDNLTENRINMSSIEDYRAGLKVERINMYREVPLMAPDYFRDLANSGTELQSIEGDILRLKDRMSTRKSQYDAEYAGLTSAINNVSQEPGGPAVSDQVERLTSERNQLQQDYVAWEASQEEKLVFAQEDMRELKRQRVQMPVLYFFMGVLFAVFGGIVFAVFIMYSGNVYYEIYALRVDGKPSKWVSTLNEMRRKDPKQPLLGFTFLVLVVTIIAVFGANGIINLF